METFKEAEIDSSGKFKYIQILVQDKTNPANSRIFVRGYKSCDFHSEIFNKFENEELLANNLQDQYKASCPGGGRIEHFPDEKKILIYGYS
jgi:phosphohistidine phosphatase